MFRVKVAEQVRRRVGGLQVEDRHPLRVVDRVHHLRGATTDHPEEADGVLRVLAQQLRRHPADLPLLVEPGDLRPLPNQRCEFRLRTEHNLLPQPVKRPV
jgi:hypothetical protein